jgi:hypothetical protein
MKDSDEQLTTTNGSIPTRQTFSPSPRGLAKVEQVHNGACVLGLGAREEECGHPSLQSIVPLHEIFLELGINPEGQLQLA